MNLLARWGRFSVVGAAGMVVQLSTLALLVHRLHLCALVASALALECTLLHNFTWHVSYTWRDRGNDHNIWTRLLRFHLTNGAASLLGNLAVMAVLLRMTHLSLVLSNGIAILCCSTCNFALGNAWVFASKS